MSSDKFIYKIANTQAYAALETGDVFPGSDHDKADGFMHFSTKKQAPIVLSKFFKGQPAGSLVLVQVNVQGFETYLKQTNGELKWEAPVHPAGAPAASLGAEMEEDKFPHVYGGDGLPLTQGVVEKVAVIVEEQDGSFSAGDLLR